MSLKVLNGRFSRIHFWADLAEVESGALDQLKNIAGLPWVRRISVMPDVHLGKGATVGSVIAMKDALAPAAVGVDIGCGVSALCTNLIASDLPDSLSELRSAIEAAIPVGFAAHDRTAFGHPHAQLGRAATALFDRFSNLDEKVQDLRGKASHQCGTLGGGNHFIELCLDQGSECSCVDYFGVAKGVCPNCKGSGKGKPHVWMVLHSGSRNIGKTLAEIHIGRAKKLAHNQLLPDPDLAVFLAHTPEMEAYERDLTWAQEYAFLNRRVMLELYSAVMKKHFPKFAPVGDPVLCHHNYVARETHFGEDLIVTRKGAIHAGKGVLGVIPGCFAAGTRILMANGLYCNIESVQVGDRIISGHGKTTTVLDVFRRGRKSVWHYRNNNFHAETVATPDHLHYVGDTAGYMKEGRIKVLKRNAADGSSRFGWRRLNDLPPSVTCFCRGTSPSQTCQQILRSNTKTIIFHRPMLSVICSAHFSATAPHTTSAVTAVKQAGALIEIRRSQ